MTATIAANSITASTTMRVRRRVPLSLAWGRISREIIVPMPSDNPAMELIKDNRLQLAVPSQIATIILPLLLGEFFQLHPEIQLEITEPAGGAALDMVEREEVDLAFVHDAEGRPNLTLRKLSSWPICLCVPRSHPLADKPSVTLAEAAAYPLVLLSRKFILTKRVLAEFDRQKLQPQILHYSPNLSSVWNIVQQGIALYRHQKRPANLRGRTLSYRLRPS